MLRYIKGNPSLRSYITTNCKFKHFNDTSKSGKLKLIALTADNANTNIKSL